ncbi:unnamed protein product, partial [Mesorhabditis belari]|uniref:HTH CENPB-type domain-containing protein n=1 Tax=Mesorhabditis belari TaxID=2138241 RepID=A0AAF3E810_9BILA
MPSPLRRSSRHHPSTTVADRERETTHRERKASVKDKISTPQIRKRKVEFVNNKNDAKDTVKKTRNAMSASTNKKLVETMKSPIKMMNTSRRKRGEPLSEDEHSEKQNIQPRKPETKLPTTITEALVPHSQNLMPEMETPEQRIIAPTKKADHEMTVKVTANDTLTVLFPERKDSPNERPRAETPNADKTQSSSKIDSPFSPTVYDENIMWGGVCQLPQEFGCLSDEEFNVEGQRYVRLTSLLNEEGFTVPVTIPVKIRIPRVQGVVYMCLADAFKANYIPVKRRSLARWVYMILKGANLLVHKAFSDLLYDYSNLFNIKLTKGMEKPLDELPFVSLKRCEKNTVAYVNGFDLSAYQYKPRQSKKNSSQTDQNVSSITDVQYLSKYIKKIEGTSLEEAEETIKTGETRKTPSPEMDKNISNNSIPLTIRVLICSGFDAGSKEIDLAVIFSLPLYRIKAVISSYATNIRELTNFLQANKERYPGTYVGLNIMMWRFFRDCRNKKLKLDETLLKEHSKRIALQLGLIDFRATDTWMNAFKRRHQIDLSTMSGEPVSYQEENGTVVCSIEPQCDQPSIDAECSACPSPDLEATRPIDIINMSLERHESISGASDLRENSPARDILPGPSSEVNEPQVELELIKSLVKSTSMHCSNTEIVSALDTIRCFILHKDPKLLIPFADLQTKIFHLTLKKEPPSNEALISEKSII